jgi:hypothetical protein
MMMYANNIKVSLGLMHFGRIKSEQLRTPEHSKEAHGMREENRELCSFDRDSAV